MRNYLERFTKNRLKINNSGLTTVIEGFTRRQDEVKRCFRYPTANKQHHEKKIYFLEVLLEGFERGIIKWNNNGHAEYVLISDIGKKSDIEINTKECSAIWLFNSSYKDFLSRNNMTE